MMSMLVRRLSVSYHALDIVNQQSRRLDRSSMSTLVFGGQRKLGMWLKRASSGT
jgi:hypothetical protein